MTSIRRGVNDSVPMRRVYRVFGHRHETASTLQALPSFCVFFYVEARVENNECVIPSTCHFYLGASYSASKPCPSACMSDYFPFPLPVSKVERLADSVGLLISIVACIALMTVHMGGGHAGGSRWVSWSLDMESYRLVSES